MQALKSKMTIYNTPKGCLHNIFKISIVPLIILIPHTEMDRNTHLGKQIKALLKQNLLKSNMNILQILQEHKTPPMQTLNCLHS